MRRIVLAALAALVILALGGTASADVLPGQSWQAAYDAAPEGATIRVAPGKYPEQELYGSKHVTFVGDEGAVVGGLDLSAPVTVRNVDIDTGSTHGQFNGANPRVPGIAFEDVNIYGDAPSVHVWASDFRWSGGEWTNKKMRLCGLDTGVPLWLNADRATIEGLTFHPWTEDDPACMHGEDIRVQGGDDVVIRNVTFEGPSDAGSGHVFVTNTGTGDTSRARRLVLEGNTFHPVIGTYAIQVIDRIDVSAWRVERNQFDQPPLFMSGNPPGCGNTGQVDGALAAPCDGTPPPPPPPPAACADGADNDGDGSVDLADAGCSDAADNDESDDPAPPPPPPGCDAACEQAYQGRIDALTAERDALKAKLAQIHALSAP